MADVTINFNDTGIYSVDEFKEKILEYAKLLVSKKTRKEQKFEKFFGCIKTNFDPLEMQKEIRNEW